MYTKKFVNQQAKSLLNTLWLSKLLLLTERLIFLKALKITRLSCVQAFSAWTQPVDTICWAAPWLPQTLRQPARPGQPHTDWL